MELKRNILHFCIFGAIVLGVNSTHHCLSCDNDCNTKTTSCTKCPKMKLVVCPKHTDICIASWTPSRKDGAMLARCFPLPPLTKRAEYSKLCKPWSNSGTYTCLCRRSGCNRIPLPTTTVPSTTTLPNTTDVLSVLSTQISELTSYASGDSTASSKPSFSLRYTLILFSLIILPLLTLGMCFAIKSKVKRSQSFPVNDIYPMEPKKLSEVTVCHILPELQVIIAKGNKSTVWRGSFSGIDVAVKCLSAEKECLWINECHIYSQCHVNHKNIATFVAASDPITNSANQTWLATKYCTQGTLQSYLESNVLSWERLLTMAKDITAGLGFLHRDGLSPRSGSKAAIAHQDLKSKNVLIEGDGTCVIADFGLSLVLTKDYLRQVHREGQVGTIRYMAPEKLEARFDIADPDSFKQIDVYALALILWEMLTRCQLGQVQNPFIDYSLPYQDLVGSHPSLTEMIDVVSVNGCRPKKPKLLMDKSTPNDVHHLWTTINECWDDDPEARLTADCVLIRLDNLSCKF